MNSPDPSSALECAPVRVNMAAVFVLPGEQIRHEVPFVQTKTSSYHSEDPEGPAA